MGFNAPTWIRQVSSPLLHKTTLTTVEKLLLELCRFEARTIASSFTEGRKIEKDSQLITTIDT